VQCSLKEIDRQSLIESSIKCFVMKKIFFLVIIIPIAGAIFFLSCKKEYSCENCMNKNQPPIANAGRDTVIVLPIDRTILDGSASTDPYGTIQSYQWTKISGPASFNISNPSDSITVLKNLVTGTYQFQLKVTDNGGLSAKDTVQVTVSAVNNRPPIADAGNDTTIILPASSIILNGSGSSDPDNNINSYVWTKISGPSSFNIYNANVLQTQVTNLVEGVYLFELKVTDAVGLSSKDTVQLTVNTLALPPSCGDTNRPHVNARLIPFVTPPQAREGMAVASAGNKILFAGGDDNLGHSSRVDIYDITTQSWSTAALSESRTSISAIAAGNKIFFGGGEIGDGTYPTKTVDIYDASTNTWSVAALSEPGKHMATAAAGSKVFFAGGEGGFAASSREGRGETVDICDLNTNTWSVGHLSEPRNSGISAVAVNDKVYFAGGEAWFGYDDWVFTDKIDIYDITSNAWSTSTLYEEKAWCAGIAVGNKIFWAGGATGNHQTGHLSCVVEIKDVNAGSSIAYLSNPGASQSFLKDGKILFFAGGNTFDIYDLTTGTWSIGVLPADINPVFVNIAGNNTIFVAGAIVNGVLSNQIWKLEF
jgi:hypothetical protein